MLKDNKMAGPNEDIARMQMKANRLIDEGLESTRRMVGLVDESQDAGNRTLVMLDEQGGKLNTVEKNLDRINKDVREAEKDLDQLEKCCGLCVWPWGKAKKIHEANKNRKDNFPTTAIADGGQKSGKSRDYASKAKKTPSGGYIARIANDDREDEMDENLTHVGTVVDTLKNMAIDMGTEIGKQNVQLDRINLKADSNVKRVDDANVRADRILRTR